jgi:primosomal protein N' (replication factor Y)
MLFLAYFYLPMYYLAEVLVPVAVYKPFTYLVPDELKLTIQPGMQVEVQFGKNKLYSGIICAIRESKTLPDKTKPILDLLDNKPIVHPRQLELWQWIADYYVCSIGEVMIAALPSTLKLSSETYLIIHPDAYWDEAMLSDDEFLIIEALSIQQRLSISDLKGILQKNQIIKPANRLVTLGFASWEEEIVKKYKVKTKDLIALTTAYRQPEMIKELLEKTKRSENQTRIALYLLQYGKESPFLSKKQVLEATDTSHTDCKNLEAKGILEIIQGNDPRIESELYKNTSPLLPLAGFQQNALKEIKASLFEKSCCLVHGVTGCGKTRIYQELILDVIQKGGQVLYLLPEISLSTQMEHRLRKDFGNTMLAYHSRVNNQKKVEIWKAVLEGHSLILGARSSVFLPFHNLQLIIVDEEHDPSYKQQDPAPHYNARDVAVYMGKLYGCNVILGSASPSIESYYQAKKQKYAYVAINQRFGDTALPELELLDLRKAMLEGKMSSIFSHRLLKEIEQHVLKKEKIILFQNRRAYAPILECNICNWKAECQNCDITLSHHKFNQTLKCHYCNYTIPMPKICPKCNSADLQLKGFGTEKIEDEIKVYFPDLRVSRFDADSTSSGKNLNAILDAFEEGELDVLVGTQMVTKGLDFDKVGLVSVLVADQMLHFPDFRANERAFQLMLQVAGRAGRREKQGKVIIQTYQPLHPVLIDLKDFNLENFYHRELEERKQYYYPPFIKMIVISIKHKDREHMTQAAHFLADLLKKDFQNRILGPTVPSIARINNYYQAVITIKMEKNSKIIATIKQKLLEYKMATLKLPGKSVTRINIDVDPY